MIGTQFLQLAPLLFGTRANEHLQAGHLGNAATNAGFTIKPQEDDGVVMPSKNSVVLEDQLMKAGEVRRSFELNTAIVKAFHSMMMMAVKS